MPALPTDPIQPIESAPESLNTSFNFKDKSALRTFVGVSALIGELVTGWAAGSVKISCSPNTEKDIYGYQLNYGTSRSSMTNVQSFKHVISFDTNGVPRVLMNLTNLMEGKMYYINAVAENTSGILSNPSSTVIALVPKTSPSKPIIKPVLTASKLTIKAAALEIDGDAIPQERAEEIELEMESIVVIPEQGAKLGLRGTEGKPFIVEKSEDLSNWQIVTDGLVPSTHFEVFDAGAIAHAQFYRVRENGKPKLPALE